MCQGAIVSGMSLMSRFEILKGVLLLHLLQSSYLILSDPDVT